MIIPGWLYNSSPHNPLDTGGLANPSLFLLPAFHLIPDHSASCTQYTSMSHVVSIALLRLLISLSPLFLFILSLHSFHLRNLLLSSLSYIFIYIHLCLLIYIFSILNISCLSLFMSSNLPFSLLSTFSIPSAFFVQLSKSPYSIVL